jgi:hypothetical protein
MLLAGAFIHVCTSCFIKLEFLCWMDCCLPNISGDQEHCYMCLIRIWSRMPRRSPVPNFVQSLITYWWHDYSWVLFLCSALSSCTTSERMLLCCSLNTSPFVWCASSQGLALYRGSIVSEDDKHGPASSSSLDLDILALGKPLRVLVAFI